MAAQGRNFRFLILKVTVSDALGSCRGTVLTLRLTKVYVDKHSGLAWQSQSADVIVRWPCVGTLESDSCLTSHLPVG